MRALIWKDIQMNRLPRLAALVGLIVPYFIPAAVIVVQSPIWEDGPATSAWAGPRGGPRG